MYHAKIWDEDKLDIHSKSYGSSKYGNIFSEDKKDDKKYHEQKYGSDEKNISSDYARKHDEKEKDDKKANEAFADEEDEKKGQELKEEELPFKAAKQIFSEAKFGEAGMKKHEPKKDDSKSIEDAIKRAIEDEKKVVIMDS